MGTCMILVLICDDIMNVWVNKVISKINEHTAISFYSWTTYGSFSKFLPFGSIKHVGVQVGAMLTMCFKGCSLCFRLKKNSLIF